MSKTERPTGKPDRMPKTRREKLGVGIVGAGWIGNVHARAWQSSASRARIVAVADSYAKGSSGRSTSFARPRLGEPPDSRRCALLSLWERRLVSSTACPLSIWERKLVRVRLRRISGFGLPQADPPQADHGFHG